MFGPKKQEVTERLKKIHNIKLHNFFSAPRLSSVIKLWWVESADLVIHLKNTNFSGK